jgi:hypothetical protein
MAPRRNHAAAVIALAILIACTIAFTRPAKFLIDGKLHLTAGAGGLGITWSRRTPDGIIHLDLRADHDVPVPHTFTSTGGYRGGGNAIPELRGVAHLRTTHRTLLPWIAGRSQVRIIFLPLWPALLLAAPFAASAWRGWRSIPPGHCPRCRYDMRALPQGAPCPECGARLSGR